MCTVPSSSRARAAHGAKPSVRRGSAVCTSSWRQPVAAGAKTAAVIGHGQRVTSASNGDGRSGARGAGNWKSPPSFACTPGSTARSARRCSGVISSETGAARDGSVSHLDAGRTSGRVRRLRAPGVRLELVQESQLSQVQWRSNAGSGSKTGVKRSCRCEYHHLVFTIPSQLADLAEYNDVVIYDILFTAAAEALLYVGEHWKPLMAQLGFTPCSTAGARRHATASAHPCRPSGGRSITRWHQLGVHAGRVRVPQGMLREEFRERFLKKLRRAYKQDQAEVPRSHRSPGEPGSV